MGSIKDRNGTDLTEAEVIKKRWQEYTEELYKKDPHNPDNHYVLITHRDYLCHEDLFLYSSSVYSCHLFLITSASVRFIPFMFFIVLIIA